MKSAGDVLVVGGGPAGSISSLILRRLGFSVRLVEAHGVPRPHVGEAISVGVLRQLTDLGIEGVLEEARCRWFTHCSEQWDSDKTIIRKAPPGSATIDRALFDAALWDVCRQANVAVTLGQRVLRLERLPGVGWNADLASGERHHAKFVVDATGRRGLLPKQRRIDGPRTIALYGYWHGDGFPSLPCIAASEAGWVWGAPVAALGFNATAFIDREALSRYGRDPEQAYAGALAAAGLLSSLGSRASIPAVAACDASAWRDEDASGADYIKVGEAAQSLDPLASMGIQKAIRLARAAAIVVNTALRRPASQLIAQRYYQDSLDRSANAHHQAVTEIYARSRFSDLPFWRARAKRSDSILRPAPAASSHVPAASDKIRFGAGRVVEHPCLCGDFVELRQALLVGPDREPIAFLGDIAVEAIIATAQNASTFGEMHRTFARPHGKSRADRIMAWLVQNQLIEPVETPFEMAHG